MSLTRPELELTVAEARAALTGAVLDRIFELDDDRILLEARAHGSTPLFLISARSSFSRAHLLPDRAPPAKTPSAFVMLLRKHLQGARVESLKLFGPDRVVQLRALRGGVGASLVAELIGRHANLFLLDEAGRILGSLRANLSHRRELWPGQPYAYPLPRELAWPPLRFDAEAPGRAAHLLYEELERRARLDGLAHEVSRALREERKRLDRRLAAIEADRARAEGADVFRRYGELLVGQLHTVRRGAASAALVDYGVHPPETVEVPLNPTLSARANAERHFQRYRKYRESLATIEGQRQRAERAATTLARLEERAAASRDDLAALGALREELVRRGVLRSKPPPGAARSRAPEARAEPFRRFLSREGKAILVGKGAPENDALTFRTARGNDLWLHARDYPGSHVVVSLARGEEPGQETLLDAATLAAHYSQARDSTVVDVAYTRRKFVSKPKGAAPGRVALSESKTLAIRIEPERLERLMRKRELEE